MRARGLASVGKITDELECNDCPDARTCSAEPADRRYGLAAKEVRRQDVRHRGETSVSEGHEPKKKCDDVQVSGKDDCEEQGQAGPAVNNRLIARGAQA